MEAIKSPSHFVMRTVVIGYDSYPEVHRDIAVLERLKHKDFASRRALQHRAQNLAEFWQAIHQPSPHSNDAVWVVRSIQARCYICLAVQDSRFSYDNLGFTHAPQHSKAVQKVCLSAIAEPNFLRCSVSLCILGGLNFRLFGGRWLLLVLLIRTSHALPKLGKNLSGLGLWLFVCLM